MPSTLLVTACLVGILLLGAWTWTRVRSNAPPVPTLTAPPDHTPNAPLSDDILDLIDEGVVEVDSSLTVVRANRAARALLGAGSTLPPKVLSGELMSIARRVLVEHREADDVTEVRAPARRSLHVRATYLQRSEGAVLFLRDVSEDHRNQLVRRQFVTHASHELKTPVAAILLLSEAVVTAAEGDPEKTRHFADRLLQESQRLDRLVTDLLDLSRLEDPGTIANSIADLSAVAAAEMTEATAQAQAKDISLTTSISNGIRVRGDGAQLALMIRNLLDNAVRYTPSGGEIALAVDAEDGEAVVRVSDTGIGIPLRDQARVFERFYRVDESRSREQGGTGLGLAIVKHVADLHGGHVSLASQPGDGSEFTVALPIVQESRQVPPAKQST
jgi:two-component system, OmpR family, sensor histidine kinase SenX3